MFSFLFLFLFLFLLFLLSFLIFISNSVNFLVRKQRGTYGRTDGRARPPIEIRIRSKKEGEVTKVCLAIIFRIPHLPVPRNQSQLLSSLLDSRIVRCREIYHVVFPGFLANSFARRRRRRRRLWQRGGKEKQSLALTVARKAQPHLLFSARHQFWLSLSSILYPLF